MANYRVVSAEPVPVKSVLKGAKMDYGSDFAALISDATLEKHRPAHMPKLSETIPMAAPSATGSDHVSWTLDVESSGVVTRHDPRWAAEVARLVGDGADAASLEVSKAARNYWIGAPRDAKHTWEYRARRATVVKVTRAGGNVVRLH